MQFARKRTARERYRYPTDRDPGSHILQQGVDTL